MPPGPRFHWRWALGAFAAAAVAGIAAHHLAAAELRARALELERAAERREEDLREALHRNGRLMADRAMAERRFQVSEQTLRHLRELLQAREAELRGLGRELDLYRKIVRPEEPIELGIFALVVAPGADVSEWRYRLVLYRSQHAEPLEGEYELELHGRQGGSRARLLLSALAPAPAQEFSFRYFAALEGRFRLPAAFEPLRIAVAVRGRSEPPVEARREFAWREALLAADGGAAGWTSVRDPLLRAGSGGSREVGAGRARVAASVAASVPAP